LFPQGFRSIDKELSVNLWMFGAAIDVIIWHCCCFHTCISHSMM